MNFNSQEWPAGVRNEVFLTPLYLLFYSKFKQDLKAIFNIPEESHLNWR